MLRLEGVWTLVLRLDSPGRKEQHTKSGTLTLQDARLPCDKRRAYAVVGGIWTLSLRLDSSVKGGLDAEPAIRSSSQKGRNARARRGILPGERFRGAVRGYSSGR